MKIQISDSARLWKSKRDWIYHEWMKLPTPQFKYDDKMIAYNQNSYHDWKMACTIISALTALWNNCWIKPTNSQINKLIQEAKKEWYDYKKWWYVQKAVNFVKKWAEKEYWMKLAYFRAYYSDFKYLTSKGFNLSWGYNNHDWVTKDKLEDGILWNDIKYWDFKYWHSFNLCEIDWNFCGLDNYVWKRKYNIFEIQNISKLVKAWVFFKYAYFFVNLEEVRKWYEWLSVEEKIKKLKNRTAEERARKSFEAYENKNT